METNQFKIESPVFQNSAEIPEDYTCHGKNISPPLRWEHTPRDAKELVLICEDPDAQQLSPFVHWVAYNIPAAKTRLEEGATDEMGKEFTLGKNSAGVEGYQGPNPPKNTGAHRYYFKLFAVDNFIDLKPGATADEVMEAMRGHIVGAAEVMGKHRYH